MFGPNPLVEGKTPTSRYEISPFTSRKKGGEKKVCSAAGGRENWARVGFKKRK